MSTKNNPGYAKAAPDEPMFVLLARDPLAIGLVRLWALRAAHLQGVDHEKVKCAAREWEMRKRVYSRLVEQGKMTKEKADMEIAMMAEIADDYRERALTEHLL